MSARTYYQTRSSPRATHFRLFVFLLLCTCLALGSFSVYRYFRVVHITCMQGGHECDQQYRELLSMYSGRSLFSEIHPTILGKKVLIKKKLPQTLVVTLENQTTLATVYLDTEKQTAAILYTDATIQKVAPDHLSSVSGTLAITDLTLLALSDSSVLSQDKYAVYTSLLEFSKNATVEEIVIKSSDEIEIKLPPNVMAVVSSQDVVSQLHSLQLLLASPTIEQKPARVDLRFDRPVLQYY